MLPGGVEAAVPAFNGTVAIVRGADFAAAEAGEYTNQYGGIFQTEWFIHTDLHTVEFVFKRGIVFIIQAGVVVQIAGP